MKHPTKKENKGYTAQFKKVLQNMQSDVLTELQLKKNNVDKILVKVEKSKGS